MDSNEPFMTMYSVEKFLPTKCPKCQHTFNKENEDWVLLFGDIVDGKKVVRKTSGYDIIFCSQCENYTARVMLESYTLFKAEDAQKLLAEKGFVNFCEVKVFNNPTKNRHVVYSKSLGGKVSYFLFL